MDFNAFNRGIIEEFRANGGTVGGQFEGSPMALLTTTGAKSGEPRVAPLVYLPYGDEYVVIASKGGAPTHPDWFHNLVANPKAHLEVGTESFDVEARITEEDERAELYAEQVAKFPGFAEYVTNASPRVIPVVVLRRI